MNWRAFGRRGRRVRPGRRIRSGGQITRVGFEALESRRVLTVSFNDVTGVLTVDGTAAADSIVVAPVGSPQRVQVTINGQIETDPAHPVVPLSAVMEVDVNGIGGDDTMIVESIDKKVIADGGTGDNKFVIVGHAAANQFMDLTGSTLSVNGFDYSFMNIDTLNVVGQGASDTLTVMTMPTFSSVLFNGDGGINTLA